MEGSRNKGYFYDMSSCSLYIKNMVCDRCIKVVRDQFSSIGFGVKSVELGVIELHSEPNKKQLKFIKDLLKRDGFELIDDKKSRIIDRIKP